MRCEHRQLPVEPEDRRRDHRDPEPDRGVVQQVARGEVVDAVDDHVVALDDLHDVGGVEAGVVLDDLDVGVQRVDRLLGGVDLRDTDAVVGVDDLALEVGEVDLVVVDDPEGPHAGRREVERRWRSEPAGSEQEDLRVKQLQLTLDADLGKEHVARVPLLLLGGERLRRLHLEAAVLPQRDAPVHRGDVLVAQELLERVRRERRPLTRLAVEDDGLLLVARPALDPRLEVAPRDVDRARQVRLLELVLLTHVDHEWDAPVPVRARDRVVHLAGIDLANLLTYLSDQLRTGWHLFMLLRASSA